MTHSGSFMRFSAEGGLGALHKCFNASTSERLLTWTRRIHCRIVSAAYEAINASKSCVGEHRMLSADPQASTDHRATCYPLPFDF